MATAIFHFGSESQYTCKMIATFFGSEKYLVDEKLVLKRWSLGIGGVREFEAKGHKIRLEVTLTSAKAFVDDVLVQEDIYSDYKDNIKKRVSESFFLSTAIRLLVWLAAAFVLILIVNVIYAAI